MILPTPTDTQFDQVSTKVKSTLRLLIIERIMILQIVEIQLSYLHEKVIDLLVWKKLETFFRFSQNRNNKFM